MAIFKGFESSQNLDKFRKYAKTKLKMFRLILSLAAHTYSNKNPNKFKDHTIIKLIRNKITISSENHTKDQHL